MLQSGSDPRLKIFAQIRQTKLNHVSTVRMWQLEAKLNVNRLSSCHLVNEKIGGCFTVLVDLGAQAQGVSRLWASQHRQGQTRVPTTDPIELGLDSVGEVNPPQSTSTLSPFVFQSPQIPVIGILFFILGLFNSFILQQTLPPRPFGTLFR